MRSNGAGAVPAPLAALLAAVITVGVAWALVMPPWQVPDEDTHFAYVQSLVERERLPGGPGSSRSTEQRLASAHARAELIRGAPGRKPEWRADAYGGWAQLDALLPDAARRDGGGFARTRNNPPAYYLYEALPYAAASDGDVFSRLYAARIWSALLVLVTVCATWLLAGELGAPRLLQLSAAATSGLHPMVTFISASVNPDAMLIAAWAVALWSGVRLFMRGFSGPGGAALIAAAVAATAIKSASWALAPAVLFAFVVAVGRLKHGRVRGAVLATGLLAGGIVAALALARTSTIAETTQALHLAPDGLADLGRFAGYLWQFYLPRPWFVEELATLPPRPAYETWVVGSWGAFAWGEVRFPPVVYGLVAASGAIIAMGALTRVAHRRAAIDPAAIGFLAIAAVALVAGLHWVDFRVADESSALARDLVEARQIPLDGMASNPFLKGRYLLPLVPLAGLAVAGALSWLPVQRRAAAVSVLLGALVVAQVAALGVVAGRFYA